MEIAAVTNVSVRESGHPRFRADQPPYTKKINGHEITFTDYGFANDGPAIVTFSGWNSDHRQWSLLTEILMTKYRVISICFEDHGFNRTSVPDYGFEDHANLALSLLDELGVGRFVCVAASNGNWAAMELVERAGVQRLPAIVVLSQSMADASAPFYAALEALQGRDTWRAASSRFFRSWVSTTDNPNMLSLYYTSTGGFAYDMWARSGRTVSAAYKKWGSPLKRLEQMREQPLVHHVYCQPNDDGYKQMHEEFQSRHAQSFSFVRIPGQTHFPHVEQPNLVGEQVEQIMQKIM